MFFVFYVKSINLQVNWIKRTGYEMSMSIFCTCTINVQCTLLLDRSCTKVKCIGTKCYVLDLSLWNITTCDDQWSVRFEWFLAKFTFKLWGNENFPVSCNFQVISHNKWWACIVMQIEHTHTHTHTHTYTHRHTSKV